MNGPEHYREAERLIQLAKDKSAALTGRSMSPPQATVELGQIDQTIVLAQVHATLALAAASAQNIRRNGAVESEPGGWSEVLS